MIYQIETIQTKKGRKLVVVYVIILLLALCISISIGVFNAKKIGKPQEQNGKIISNEQNIQNAKNEAQAEKPNISESQEKVDTQNSNVPKKQPTQGYTSFIKNVQNIYNGTEGKRVFLTFDDGPSKAVTPHILDTLKTYNIKATFFVLGSRVKLNPDIVKREYQEGHYVANHGYSHKYSKIYVSSNEVIKEYNKTETEIQKALRKQKLFKPFIQISRRLNWRRV